MCHVCWVKGLWTMAVPSQESVTCKNYYEREQHQHEQWLGHFIMEISILYYLASMNIYLVSKDINLVMKINLRLL